jgi:tetratricopeptide (TPR) repeat protein
MYGQTADQVAKAQQGKELMAAGRFAEAAAVYSELVRAIPGNPGLLLNLGMAHHMAGQNEQAIAPLEAALKIDPGILPANLFLGLSYLSVGKPAQAVPPLEKTLELAPDHAEARKILAGTLLEMGRPARAAGHYRALIERDRNNPGAWYGLGRAYEALAQSAFSELEKAAPESGHWFALVAGTRMVQRQYSSAFFFYRKALEKAPGLRGAHQAIAEIYRQTGHPDWAAAEDAKEQRLGKPNCAVEKIECAFRAARYGDVAKATAKSPAALYWRSKAYNELAIQAFSELAKLPPSPELHQFTAEVHRNQRRYLESAAQWREALKLKPGDPILERELAITLHLSGDFKTAAPILERLAAGDPESPELNYLLGDSYLNLQQVERAIPYLKKAVARDPKMLPSQAALARAYLQAGQGAEAVPHLEAALPIDDDGSLHYQLARAYQASGKREQASALLKKYQDIRRANEAERERLEAEVKIAPP